MQDKETTLPSEPPVKGGQGFINNIPAQFTNLVGRAQDVKTVCMCLQCSEVRLVTLTGMGGVGKTRLALQVATELLHAFADGVCFVSLAFLHDVNLVVPTIAQALGLSEEQSLLLRLKAYLRNKHLLLFLDGFEYVATAAPLLIELLQACPDLKAVVTSRSLLHVRGEYEFQVLPLALPSFEQLADSETVLYCPAMALFAQCVQAIKPDFEVTRGNARIIAEICICLEGLPLAIELAAARMRLLSLQELLALLGQRLLVLTSGARDVPDRQQTLLKTLTWSYDLLSAREQRLFRYLSVFVDGCTLEAVEALCRAETENVLDEVGALVDKNLLQRTETASGQTWLVIPEIIREFGLERLKQNGEIEVAQNAVARVRAQLGEKSFAWVLSGRPLPNSELALAVEVPSMTIGEQFPIVEAFPLAATAKLTAREGEVLRLVAAGLTSAQIAKQLVVSRHTVNIHVRSIYSKLRVNSRSAATRYAFEHHLI